MKFLILLLSIGIVDAVPYTYVGCFTDIRQEWVFFWWTNGQKNADGCAIACEAQKFSHFGMGGGYGKDCHCGSGGYDRYGSSGGCSDCNFSGQTYRCAQSSGDPWRLIAVYQLTSADESIDERYIGCWHAWNPPYMVGSPQRVGLGTKQNVSQCAGACKQQGAVYAGIRNNGTECYCGSDLQWETDGRYPADTTKCYLACDDGKSCGGDFNHISLYRAACLTTEYGTNCSRCNCMNNVPCNAITGVCPGSCATEWTTSYAGGTCSVAFPLGLFVDKSPCGGSLTWQGDFRLAPITDGTVDTCFDTSTISNDTWRMWWKLNDSARFQTVSVIYKDTTSCGGIHMPVVSVKRHDCNEPADCTKGVLLYPKVMSVPDQCSYISPGNMAYFIDSIYIEFPANIIICEMSLL